MWKWLLAVAAATIGSSGSTAPLPETPAYVTITVPVGATLLVNGVRTNQMTAVRSFVSPPLPEGKFYYTFTAHFTWNGEAVSKWKQVVVSAGTRLNLDMMTGEDISTHALKPTPPASSGSWTPPAKPEKPKTIEEPKETPKVVDPPKKAYSPQAVERDKKPIAPPPRPSEEPKKSVDPLVVEESKPNPFRRTKPKDEK